jgi:sigma-B regulation protein RsbU (phosphoserine phosphatase)
MRSRFLHLRLWLEHNGLFPRGRLAVVTTYLFALDLVLFAVQEIAVLFHRSSGAYLRGWVTFLSLVAIGCLLVLANRRLSSRLLWRMRNRLLVTYVFIGVIPLILLVSLAGLAFYLFAGQFATYIVTSELSSELRELDAANQAFAHALAAELRAGRSGEVFESTPPGDSGSVSAWLNDKPLLNSSKNEGAISVPAYIPQQFAGVVRDDNRFLLRSLAEVSTPRGKLNVVSSRALGPSLLANFATGLGEVTVGEQKSGTDEEWVPMYSAGTIPPRKRAFDLVVTLGTHVSAVNWSDGKPASPVVISVQTRLSSLYHHLFSALGDLAPTIEVTLVLLAILLGVFELIALYIGTRLTRTVTGTVSNLYRATTHINRGDFSHRIPITSNDQLAALAGSFNLMTESIEKLILEQKEKQRLENEITIAQEVQSQLFPRRISQLTSLEVHGFCRPARSVSGDYYDFLPLGSDRLVLAVGDVSGKGISAALLMATIHSAVRAYSIEGIPVFRQAEAVGAGPVRASKYDPIVPGAEASPSTLLSLLNHQLYHSTPAEKYATLFLATYDGDGRRLIFSNAGHLPPLLLGASGSIRRLEHGGTVVGLFDDLTYDEGTVQMRAGDIFLAYSDGVTEPENEFGEFGEPRLIELVQENRDRPLQQITEIVTAAVDDWIGGAEQPDDVTLVLARAR